MIMVKELHDELTKEYNEHFNSGEISGKIIEHVKIYKGIVPMITVYNELKLSGNQCSLVYLHTVIGSRFCTFEESGKAYVDFDSPLGIIGWSE